MLLKFIMWNFWNCFLFMNYLSILFRQYLVLCITWSHNRTCTFSNLSFQIFFMEIRVYWISSGPRAFSVKERFNVALSKQFQSSIALKTGNDPNAIEIYYSQWSQMMWNMEFYQNLHLCVHVQLLMIQVLQQSQSAQARQFCSAETHIIIYHSTSFYPCL
jgi:hypothetical protein